ncbi:MAG: hypothetical protein JWN17_1405 [Frankiales bacterium]|nr:hypothetical protein [Frankiales bacterium]
MTRLHTDPVEVRTRDDEPEQFLWRDRLYVVREVLARWTEAGSWWQGGAVRALCTGDASSAASSGLAPLETTPLPPSPKWGQRAWGEPAPDVGTSVGPASIDDRERTWFRVEAGQGRAAGTGVFDLCFDWSANRWSLARVLD